MGVDPERPSMLLHSCCGPCSTAVVERLESIYRLTIFFYNPNITDAEEYDKRKQAQISFLHSYNARSPIGFIEGDFEPDKFLTAARGMENEPEGGSRCRACFRLRLEKTAIRAKEDCFDCFCTTLSVSPHKNATLINALGLELQGIHGINYISADFKKKDGYRRSVTLSREYGLYRQDYCGCSYSKVK